MRRIIYLFCLLLTSCSEIISVDIDSVQKSIVIYGFITSDTQTQRLEISSTVAYGDTTTNPYIVGASVSVAGNGNTYNYSGVINNEGIYLSDDEFGAVYGEVYTLTVSYDFDGDGIDEIYTAETTLAEPSCMSAAAVYKELLYGFGFYTPYFMSSGRSAEQYWYVYFDVDNYDLYDDLADVSIMEASTLVGTAPTTGYVSFVSSSFRSMFFAKEGEELISGMFDEESNFQPVFVGEGDKITMVSCTIEQGFYNFLSALKQSTGSSNPVFGSGAVFLSTNISGNVYGYFGSLNQTHLQITVGEYITDDDIEETL